MKIVAITSCANGGLAHNLQWLLKHSKKFCKKNHHECKVETQGALGIENQLKPYEIEAADLIVFANDVGISKAERFDKYKDKIQKVLTP